MMTSVQGWPRIRPGLAAVPQLSRTPPVIPAAPAVVARSLPNHVSPRHRLLPNGPSQFLRMIALTTVRVVPRNPPPNVVAKAVSAPNAALIAATAAMPTPPNATQVVGVAHVVGVVDAVERERDSVPSGAGLPLQTEQVVIVAAAHAASKIVAHRVADSVGLRSSLLNLVADVASVAASAVLQASDMPSSCSMLPFRPVKSSVIWS